MTTTPPGWYDDGHGARRWWDGAQWTEHVASQAEADPATGPGGSTQVWTAPGGYPGAGSFAGAGDPAAAGAGATTAVMAPAAPVEPGEKSRLWIVWVVIGAVMVAILVAAAVLIPVLLNLQASGSTADGAGSGSSQSAGDAGELSTADKEGSVAAVELLDHAWRNADCEEFFAATTENYRIITELETCEAFYPQARAYMQSIADYAITIRDVESVGSAVAVSTTETYDAYWDMDGEPTEDLHSYEDLLEYFVVAVDGEWRVDDFFTD